MKAHAPLKRLSDGLRQAVLIAACLPTLAWSAVTITASPFPIPTGTTQARVPWSVASGTEVDPVSGKSETTPAMSASVGYRFTITNPDKTQTGQLTVTGTIYNTFKDEAVLYESVVGANTNCSAVRDTTNGQLTNITCYVGSIPAWSGLRGSAYPSATFTVYFRSPNRISTSRLAGDSKCSTTTDCLTFAGKVAYGTVTPIAWSSAKVALGSSTPNTRVDSAVPKFPSTTETRTYFTGTPGSLYTEYFSSVQIPYADGTTTVSIVETSFSSIKDGAGNSFTCTRFNTCWQSQITAPPPSTQASWFPNYLTVTLRHDLANIKPTTLSAGIGSVAPRYMPSTSSASNLVPNCNISTTTNLPYPLPAGQGPCVANRQVTTSGDWVWTLISYTNGFYWMD